MTLGDRMKSYEHVYRTYLPRRTYTLIRVDGRAFHTYTKEMKKPFDPALTFAMLRTARQMCQDIPGVAFAYTQSDEISLLLTDFENHETQPWMGANLSKVLSLSASIATAQFNDSMDTSLWGTATFDSRAWTMSDANEVANYFIWRQRDAIKNAISATAQVHFPARELEGKNSDERIQMLLDVGITYTSEVNYGLRMGSVVIKEPAPWAENRTEWNTYDAPRFVIEPDSFFKRIPKLPTLP